MTPREIIQRLMDLGMPQDVIARKIQVHRATVSRIFHGQTVRPHPGTVARLEALLDKTSAQYGR